MLEIIIPQRITHALGRVPVNAGSGFLFERPFPISPQPMSFGRLARMANPQWENGFVKIATEIWEQLCQIRIPGEVRQVVDVIIRKTWGFNKKWDWISLSQFYKATGIHKPNIIRALRLAIGMNIILKKENTILNNENTPPVSYSFNKDYESWRPLSKKRTFSKKRITVIKKENLPLSKKRHTIDNTTIDTSTKDSSHARASSPHDRLQSWIQSEEGKTWIQEQIKIYDRALIEHEYLKARQWVRDNPKRGNKRNWKRFLSTWFGKADESRSRKETQEPLPKVR